MVEKKSGEKEKRNIRFNSRRCERRLLVQLNTRRSECQTLKKFLSLTTPAFEFFHCHRVSRRTNLVIFFKPTLKSGFFILKGLFTSKTPTNSWNNISQEAAFVAF